MDYSNKDLHYMQLAIDLAAQGFDATAPNPNVGCVIVKDNQIIAKSYHHAYGLAHAEINALNIAGSAAKDATMYVNLEPCSHYGKTPPCVDMIIERKIKHVIIAISDPFHMVNGSGIKKLREAGIAVDIGCLTAQALEVNLGFLSRVKRNRPWINMCIDNENNLLTVDTVEHKLSNARINLRAKSDLLITDFVTAAASKMQNKTIKKMVILNPAHIASDASARTLLADNNNLVLTNLYPTDKLEIKYLLQQLALLKHNYALIEATFALNTELLENNLVDEVVVFLKPNLDKFTSNQIQILINKYHFKIINEQIVDNHNQVKLRKEFDTSTLLT